MSAMVELRFARTSHLFFTISIQRGLATNQDGPRGGQASTTTLVASSLLERELYMARK